MQPGVQGHHLVKTVVLVEFRYGQLEGVDESRCQPSMERNRVRPVAHRDELGPDNGNDLALLHIQKEGLPEVLIYCGHTRVTIRGTPMVRNILRSTATRASNNLSDAERIP